MDCVVVYGKVDCDLFVILLEYGGELVKWVILCDIEGVEFDLFDDVLLE